MSVPSSVESAYRQVEPALAALAAYVGSTMRAWCNARNYMYSERVKMLDSLAEKLETGRFERWSDLDDLFACTVVVPTASHDEGVIAFLDEAFERSELRLRNSTQKPPEVFRFDSTRFIGRVTETAALELPPGCRDIRFEIQVPAVFEHAWSVVTHDLAYKADDADWRRARLAAQLKAAVEQIELVIAGYEANIVLIAASGYPEAEAMQEIVETFKGLWRDGYINNELVPASWNRFATNVYALVGSYAKNRYQRAPKAKDLCAAIVQHVHANDPFSALHGGSLFQCVTGLINAGVVPGANIDSFVIVESSELRDIHGVIDVNKPFAFD